MGISIVNKTGATGQGEPPPALAVPSAFYRAWFWKVGLRAVKIVPACVLKWVCLSVAELYYRVCRGRRETVIQNLLPAVNGDRAAAERTAHALFHQFGLKLMDLWRFETGYAVDTWFTAGIGWDLLETAYKRGKGLLLVMPHLGNWELGGPLLAKMGIKLVVLTQAEPGRGLTELRMASRARWGIETVLVGEGGFEFVQIIKRLQEGGIVALLIDRPPAAKAVTVELFGSPFRASIAGAELARASGCALMGVNVVRRGDHYEPRILPEFHYDRRDLGDREKRCELTRQIVRALEPEIRLHLDQWFHFVPIWPEEAAKSGLKR